MKHKALRSNLLAKYTGGAIALLTAQQASAAEKIWNGGGANDSWLTAGNWTGGVPANSTATDTATFGTSSRHSIYLGTGDRSINGMTFNSATSYNLNLYDSDLSTSRMLIVGAGGITVSSGNHTISGAKPGSGTAGTLDLVTNGTVMNIATGSTLTFDVRINPTTSSNTFSKTGGGTLVFNADNSGSQGWNISNGAGFTVSDGTLKLGASGVTGNSSNKFTVSNGATLELAATGAYGSNNGILTLSGTGVGGDGALYASATTAINSGSGTGLVLAANSRIGVAADQTLTVGMPVSGGFALEKSGDGTLALGGTNTYIGDTLVSAGTLFVNGSLASGSDVTVTSTGTIGGTGTIASTLTFDAGADLDLTGSSLGFTSTGILTVAAGQTMTFTDFQFTDIVGWNWAAADAGTYTLINGGGTVSFGANTPTFDDPFDFGNGKTGYFQQGSFQAVIIPEPTTALLSGLGLLALLRRRRQA